MSKILSSFGLTRCFDAVKYVQTIRWSVAVRRRRRRCDEVGTANGVLLYSTVDKYFPLLLIAVKTISLVRLTYPDFSY